MTRPSDFSQAAESDALGIATASMFTALVPAAIKAVRGWFAGDDGQPDRPRYAGYTGRLHIDPGQAESSQDSSAVPFYRTEGQPVSLSVRFSHDVSYGIRIVVDDQELGVFNDDAVDVPVPDALLASALPGDVHLLEVSPASRSPLSKPVEVDVVVVVYAADHGLLAAVGRVPDCSSSRSYPLARLPVKLRFRCGRLRLLTWTKSPNAT